MAKEKATVIEVEDDDTNEQEQEDKTKSYTKVYHVNKRASDGKWTIKFARGERVIKLCETKVEAVAYAKSLAEKQDGVVLVHNSKGKNKGKIAKQ